MLRRSLQRSTSAAANKVLTLTATQFENALGCPKKFLLNEYLPKRHMPVDESSGIQVRMAEAGQLRTLAQQYESKQSILARGKVTNPTALAYSEPLTVAGEFDQAAVQTQTYIERYFECLVAQKQQGVPLVINQAAVKFRATQKELHELCQQFPLNAVGADGDDVDGIGAIAAGADDSHVMEFRARIDILRFNPLLNFWSIQKAKTSTKPLVPKTKKNQLANRLSFEGFVLENFLSREVKLPEQHSVTVGAMGLLHPWQHFPGPISMTDNDMRRLYMLLREMWMDQIDPHQSALMVGKGLEGKHIRNGNRHSKNYPGDAAVPSAAKLETYSLTPRKAGSLHLSPAFLGTLHNIYYRASALMMESARPSTEKKKKIHLFDKSVRQTVPCGEDKVVPDQLDLRSFCKAPTPCPFFSPGYCLPSVCNASMTPAVVEKKSKDGSDETTITIDESKASQLLSEFDPTITKSPLRQDAQLDLWSQGVHNVNDMSEGCLEDMSTKDARYFRAVQEQKIILNPRLIQEWVADLKYPVFCLDFEAGAFTLPPFSKVNPYTPIPFQYSLHVFQHDILTEKPTEYNFLHLGAAYHPLEDPREELMRKLLEAISKEREKKRKVVEALAEAMEVKAEPETKKKSTKKGATGKKGAAAKKEKKPTAAEAKKKKAKGKSNLSLEDYAGCFVAHNASYEQRCLQKMACMESITKEEKKAVKEFDFVDTLDLVKSSAVHPFTFGSNSMKAILPSFCPHIQYSTFGEGVAANGDNAAALYRLWIGDLLSGGHIQPHTEAEKIAHMVDKANTVESVRKHLLEYCNTDVRGMWELVRALHRMSQQESSIVSHKWDV